MLFTAYRKVCRKCGDKVVSEYKCSGCGKEMVFNYHEKYNLELKQGYSYCTDCRAKIVHTAYCTNCGKRFEMDGGEVDYFKTRGWELPKLCTECRQRNRELVKCPLCHKEIEFGKTVEGYCRECLDEDLITPYKCENCGAVMRYTNYDKYIANRGAPHALCRKCYEAKAQKNRTAHSGYCTECGKQFEMTGGEVEFYKSNGLELPKRCPKCRGTSKKEYIPKNPETKSFFGRIFGSIFK